MPAGEMRICFERQEYAKVLELGKDLATDLQFGSCEYNGAAFTVYSWGYLSGNSNPLGNPCDARIVFRRLVKPEYIERRYDMDKKRIMIADEKDAAECA